VVMHMFFPNNYMLSQAVMRILYTGGEPGEVLAAVEEIREGQADEWVARWPKAWAGRADDCAARAKHALERGHVSTARGLLLRGCAYLQWSAAFGGEVDGEGVRELHRRSREHFAQFAELSQPRIESVSVPYEGASFPAWFVPGRGGADEKRPVAVYLPGWDSTKEQGYQLAEELAERGISTLLCDGPGIGEALYELGLPNRFDYEVPGSAAIDYAISRDDVDPNALFVVGSSLGGYRAARTCAFDNRMVAAVIWGAMWDFHEVWLSGRQRGGVSPTRDEHAVRAMGVNSIEEVAAALRSWKLDGVAHQISCPILILHGELDRQVPMAQADKLFATVASADKTLRVYGKDELGSAHCQNDHREVAHTDIADWLVERVPSSARSERAS
jgi:alpha-beta hydrolase superfamily lysophospholipase